MSNPAWHADPVVDALLKINYNLNKMRISLERIAENTDARLEPVSYPSEQDGDMTQHVSAQHAASITPLGKASLRDTPSGRYER